MAASNSNNKKITIKVLLVGDSGVGKSSLLLSFTNNTFNDDQPTTIGIDFKVKRVDVVDSNSGESKQIAMQVWDTAGQERFRTLTSSYYRNAHAVVLVYDVNEPATFYNIRQWLDEADRYCRPHEFVSSTFASSSSSSSPPPNFVTSSSISNNDNTNNNYRASHRTKSRVIYMLVGNKTDKVNDEKLMAVKRTTAEALAREHHMLFALTSAKTRKGVAQAFDEVARCVYDEISANMISSEWDNMTASQITDASQPQWTRRRRCQLGANDEENYDDGQNKRLCC